MKKITASIAALLFGGVLSGCAHNTQAAAPAPAPAAAAEGRAVYQQIADSVFGTPEERLASEKAASDKFQNDLARCMSAVGSVYTKGQPPRQAGGNQAPGDLDSLAESGNTSFGIADAVRATAEIVDARDPAYAKMTAAERDAQGKALSTCFTKVDKPSGEPGPAVTTKLARELVLMFEAIEKQPAVREARASYGACMNDAGFKTTSYLDTYLAAKAKYPDRNAGWAALQKDPKWADAVAFEQKAAAADTSCRQPVIDQATAAAQPQLTAFAIEHATDLTAAETAWTALTR
jgi:hypothetical protein